MAVDRKQVEAVAFDAYMFPNGTHWMMSAEVLAELCRAWLALDAAPEGTVSHVEWEDSDKIIPHIDKDEGDVLMWEHVQEGQRVRLVATPASGGSRDG